MQHTAVGALPSRRIRLGFGGARGRFGSPQRDFLGRWRRGGRRLLQSPLFGLPTLPFPSGLDVAAIRCAWYLRLVPASVPTSPSSPAAPRSPARGRRCARRRLLLGRHRTATRARGIARGKCRRGSRCRLAPVGRRRHCGRAPLARAFELGHEARPLGAAERCAACPLFLEDLDHASRGLAIGDEARDLWRRTIAVGPIR